MTNKFGTTDDWEDGDILFSDDLLDTFGEVKWFKKHTATSFTAPTSIIGHSSTVFSALANGQTVHLSSDTLETWTSKSTTLDTVAAIIGARTDRALGFGVENVGTTQESIYTSTSGTTWSATTSLGFGTGINDVSFPASGLIVVVGDDAGGTDHVVFSTDQAGSWTDASTQPSLAIVSVAMFDTSTGYGVDTSGNIWKTTNGAVDWTDTTDNVSNFNNTPSRNKIYCISADIVLFYSSSIVYKYVNSTNTITTTLQAAGNNCGGIIETNNGTIYILGFHDDSTGALYKTTDSGVSWYTLGVGLITSSAGTFSYKQTLSEIGSTNSVVIAGGGHTLIFHEQDF